MQTDPDFCTRTGRTISQKIMEDGTANAGEPSSPLGQTFEPKRQSVDSQHEDKSRKRMNPLRIHLAKRPFLDNSIPYNTVGKKKRTLAVKASDTNVKFHNATSQLLDKPVPRLVPKSQISQFNKGKIEKSLALQPMVKFECRKCRSMSFETLAMLKEHQQICRAQAKEPAISPAGPSRVTRKVYLCSACGTYYENWNLFLHMREVHDRHICLFCLGMFSKAEKLWSHLTNEHNVQEFNYNSQEESCNVYNGSFYFMCCACHEICSEKGDIFNHDCNNVKPEPVPVLRSKNSLKTNMTDSTPNHSELTSPTIPNGEDSIPTKLHDCNSPPISENQASVPEPILSKREKECGLKLKPSLNSAKSRGIVDSTVDPTVGQQYAHKPPKRYEKDNPSEPTSQPKTPTIKMTICLKADNPFVKTTFFENNKETTLVNNNIEPVYNTRLTETQEEKIELAILEPQINSESLESMNSGNGDVTTESIRVHQNDNETSARGVVKETTLKTEVNSEPQEHEVADEINVEEITPMDTTPAIELTLDRPIDKYPLRSLLKVFLRYTYFNCIYCNHARKIAVNCRQLALHMVEEHKFSATVNSITAEELLPETIAAKVKVRVDEGSSVFINLDSYDSEEKCENIQSSVNFECFQCYVKTTIHKDLYLHNRKMHQKSVLLCIMCKNNFYTFSELLCHLCPGTYDSNYLIKYRCCFCNVDSISSSFRLMVHLRKIHHTCDVCLEFCQSQARLSNHVWKHKLHHYCFRCGISYRNKPDINNHLFWKHGTESVLCKRCLQKKWPHVYHFCNPPAVFVCDECNLQFTRAVCLKVHKRLHSSEFPHMCTEEGCEQKFISKKLLKKHVVNEISNTEASNQIPIIDLVDDVPKNTESETKVEANSEITPKKSKKKKLKVWDALMMDVNLPALNLSESDSSDESDSGLPPSAKEDTDDKGKEESTDVEKKDEKYSDDDKKLNTNNTLPNAEVQKPEPILDEKPCEQQVLEIWDNFQKYSMANNVGQPKEKTPPPQGRRHVCESDHDYCLIPADMNGDEDLLNYDKKRMKKSPKKRYAEFSSSSSSSSDSDSSSSCGSNCSCSSSSGSSSSSSSDSDSSDESGNENVNPRKMRKLSRRRMSNGSNVDVMGMTETPILVPEKAEPTIAETDLETDESETDEEFYDANPQLSRIEKEKRTRPSTPVGPTNEREMLEEVQDCTTPVKEEMEPKQEEYVVKEKTSSNKKKSEKKKKSKSSKKHAPIKINIPKDIITKSEVVTAAPPLIPNKITVSLQSNPSFCGYSSDEEANTPPALKPQLPPNLEWRKEDLPSQYNYNETIRLKAPIPDPEPPRFLMNSESMESSDSDSSHEGALEIYQPSVQNPTLPPYAFQRPAVGEAKEGEIVYCYCRCPYDEVSDMIACDAEGCPIEWFHFECVGVVVPPKGKWYCPECRKNQNFSGYCI